MSRGRPLSTRLSRLVSDLICPEAVVEDLQHLERSTTDSNQIFCSEMPAPQPDGSGMELPSPSASCQASFDNLLHRHGLCFDTLDGMRSSQSRVTIKNMAVFTGAQDSTVDLVVVDHDGPVRLMLYVPAGPAPAAGWPALYMVDGNAVFATARDAVRAQSPYPNATGIGPGVIVAIGYATEDAYDPFRRSWDLSPPPGRTYPPFAGTDTPVRTGGAEPFIHAVERVILPFVESKAPTDPKRRTLFGHSFGGLFALYALYTRPTLFDTYVAASPALYWEDEALRPFENAFSPPAGGRRKRVLLSAGEWEGDELAPFQRSAPDALERLAQKRLTRTVDMARDLAERLRTRHSPSVEARYETYAGETHMSVLPVAVSRAVQASFSIAASHDR